MTDPAARCQLQAKMLALDMALESLRSGGCVPHEYRRRIAERLSERALSRAALDTK
ncbi:Methyl-accepting chemotaxis protein [Candidatus Paraburkholderia kirkii UZHbot1]|uniref:Methyl-accepting chemotaxis protein n=1 Tax=Candidatus Paraburkholderia kirkii UZHbot1 TaxID=1055526 RepID=G4MK02_9BURK|nr:Methyl-accepting chemotaxis protein [Candidatus Paraburkholderia kirkii UZHbot1]